MNDLSPFGALLEETLGMDPGLLGADALARTVSGLVADAECGSPGEYLELIRASRRERERFLGAFLVHETWFFRDSEPFVFLRKYIREVWLPSNPLATLRILSAPCSTGEEPYSIAGMLLEEVLPPERFRIDAVDISARALETARRAVYGNGSFREIFPSSTGWLSPCEGGMRPEERVRQAVHFQKADLLDPGFLKGSAPFHVVFCRNLIVYLTVGARKRVWANLDRLLAPDGLIFTGSAEVPFFSSCGMKSLRHPRSFSLQRPEQKPLKSTLHGRKPPRMAKRPSPPLPGPEAPVSPPAKEKSDRPGLPQPFGPDDPSFEEVRSLADRGELRKALARCEEIVGKGNATAEVYYLAGLIHDELGRVEESEEHLLKAVYLDPRHHEAMIHLSLLYQRKGDSARAGIYRDRAKRVERNE
ncbi:MAG: CheR family methyltransferase [Candidatus Latescibacterota bacterium]